MLSREPEVPPGPFPLCCAEATERAMAGAIHPSGLGITNT